MPATSNITLSIARSELSFSASGRDRALTVRRSAQARAMRLAVDPRDGAVRLTLPRRASLAAGLTWAESKRAWIESQLAALPAPHALAPGAVLPVEGVERRIDWSAHHPRAVRLDDDALRVGGPEDMVAGRLLRWLKARALATLDAETRALAQREGIAIGRVGIGDPRGRWGSCSSSGDIRYSWRLILAPPDVRLATVAHEVAHRLHMDHGPDFHHAVTRLLGHEPKAERAWLRAHGGMIQALGRG